MSDPTFGMSITRKDNEPRPAVGSDLSVVGLVGFAPAASEAAFPLNTPVQIFSDDAVALASLGAEGTLPQAISLVNAQLGEYQAAAKIVIVRCEYNDGDEAANLAALVGDAAAKSGLHALLEAGPVLGVVPRLIGVPGYTWQQESGLAALTLTGIGSNLTEAPAITFTGGGNDPGKVLPTAHAVLGEGANAGKVVSVVIDTPGANLTAAPVVVFSGGGEDEGKTLPTATAELGVLANVVCAALPPILEQLVGHAVVQGPGTSLLAYTNWRETISSMRLIPLETGVKVGSPAEVVDGVATVLGIAVRRDHEKGGKPFHSWANQPVYGIVGPQRPLRFSLTDGATEAQQILSLNGGVILRGEAGVEGAIAAGGFVYIGTDTAAEDDLWRFYNVSRGRDYIHLLFLRTLRFYLGRFNITGQAIEAVVNTMKLALRDLQADGNILGYTVGFTRDQNSPENLRLGKFTVNFAAEEAPVLRQINIDSSRYRPALDMLLDQLLAQMDQNVAA